MGAAVGAGVAVGLIVYTHVGYPVLLWVLARVRGHGAPDTGHRGNLPSVSLIIAAYDEASLAAQPAFTAWLETNATAVRPIAGDGCGIWRLRP